MDVNKNVTQLLQQLSTITLTLNLSEIDTSIDQDPAILDVLLHQQRPNAHTNDRLYERTAMPQHVYPRFPAILYERNVGAILCLGYRT
jgi:hypothetical protein